MHLMYLGNTDVVGVQMSKVHSHYGSSAGCHLATIHRAIPCQSNNIFQPLPKQNFFEFLVSDHNCLSFFDTKITV